MESHEAEILQEEIALERWLGEGGAAGDRFGLLARIDEELDHLRQPWSAGGDTASVKADRRGSLPFGLATSDGISQGPENARDRPAPGLRWLLKGPVWLYRLRLGWLLGQRFLLLTHRGRRTGRLHETVVEVVGYDRVRREYTVMSGFGRSADWFQNTIAGGAVFVDVGRKRFRPNFRLLDIDEASAGLADYERRNRLIRPIVRWVLSKLVGWHYDGSESSRRNLVSELPLLAFNPKAE